MLADWFSEQFSTGVLIVPCMLTLAIPGVLPRFKAEQMMPAIALIVSVIASVVIGGAGSLAFPLPALIWCAVRYTPQVTCLLTFVTGAVEIVLVANSVIDISVGSPFSIQKIVGDKGLVARMGGEEFAVAVPSVNPVDGLLMAEKIRKGVELQPFTWQQKTLYLTVSIGVGSGRASYRTLTDDFNKLMVEADTCLYRSKKDGRNRTSTMRYGEEVV